MTLQHITQDELAAAIDHAVLRPTATLQDVRAACELAKKYPLASACVRPCDVAAAAKLLAGTRTVASTVIAFPHGTTATAAKVAEAARAAADGAEELDMVLNIGRLIEGDMNFVRDDIAAVVAAAGGRCVKVILECCFLNREQMAAACDAIITAGADFAKTSTGFGSGGATVEDVAFLRSRLPAHIGVKASGGIATLADATAMLQAGATRLGTSKTQNIMEEIE